MKLNFLKKILHVSNYLSLQVAGVEICNKSIKYIEFLNKNGVFSVKNFGEVVLSPNTVKDGDILNKNALIEALTEVKSNISSDFVSISIPEEKTYVFDVELPKEAEANLREALEFKIEENAPLKLDEASFEYEVVDRNESSKDIIVSVSVIPNKVISDYADIFDKSGIYTLSYEIESKMVASSVISKGDKRDYIIIDIKDDSTIFIAVINGFVRLTSTITIGESLIRETLLKTGLFSDELVVGKYFESDFSFETTYSKESYSSLVNIFSIFKDEVEKFNKYVLNKFPDIDSTSSKNIDKIILCGRSATLPGFAKHINQNIKADVMLANTWVNVFDIREHSSNMKFSDSLSFVVPIGLVVSSNKK